MLPYKVLVLRSPTESRDCDDRETLAIHRSERCFGDPTVQRPQESTPLADDSILRHRTQKAVWQRMGPWSSESGWHDSWEQLCISLPEIRILTYEDTDDRWMGTRGGDKLNPSMKQYPKSGGRQLSLPSPSSYPVRVIHSISLASFSSASLVSASGS